MKTGTRIRRRLRPPGLLGAAVLLATSGAIAQEVRAPELDASAQRTYCELAREVERLGHPGPGYEQLSNQQQYRLAKQLADSAKPLVGALHDLAPPVLRADTATLVEGTDEVSRSGDFRVLGLRGGQAVPEDAKLGPNAARYRQAIARLHAWHLRHCGWQGTRVTEVEYGFAQAPATLKPGLTSFELANQGREPHEMNIQRLEGDVDVGELLREVARQDAERPQGKAPDGELDFRPGATTYLGEAFAPAGKTDNLVLDLKPGRYVMVCFVPRGTVYVSEQQEYLGAGPPHALLGMVHTFDVR